MINVRDWLTRSKGGKHYRDTVVGCSFIIAVCICFMYQWGPDRIARHQLIWVQTPNRLGLPLG